TSRVSALGWTFSKSIRTQGRVIGGSGSDSGILIPFPAVRYRARKEGAPALFPCRSDASRDCQAKLEMSRLASLLQGDGQPFCRKVPASAQKAASMARKALVEARSGVRSSLESAAVGP